jgi:hypothetical protein
LCHQWRWLDNDKGEYTLQRINYAGNSVRLTYEDRDDAYTSYQAGSKLQQVSVVAVVVNTAFCAISGDGFTTTMDNG